MRARGGEEAARERERAGEAEAVGWRRRGGGIGAAGGWGRLRQWAPPVGERGMGRGAVGPQDCLGRKLKIWVERPVVAAGFKEKEREERLDWAEKKERGEGLRWVWDFGFLFFLFFFFSFFFNTHQPKTNPTKIMQHTYIILFKKQSIDFPRLNFL
jgi:hypothetical protein